MPRILNANEAARELGISMDALYRLIYAGKLQAHKSDGKWFIQQNAVEARLRIRGKHE